jgi:hypothetical protein
MHIDHIAAMPITRGLARLRRAAGAGGGFQVTDAQEAPAQDDAASVGATVLATPIGALDAHEVSGHAEEPVSDEAAGRHGQALLAELAKLQVACLTGPGAASGSARAAIDALAQSLPGAATPGLQTVLRAVAQRARIEAARSE